MNQLICMTNPRRTYSAVMPSSSRMLDDSIRQILSPLNFEEFSSNKKMKRSLETYGRMSGSDKYSGSHTLCNIYGGLNRQGSSDQKILQKKGKGKISLSLMIKMHNLCDHEVKIILCRFLKVVHNQKLRFFLSIAACNIVVCVVPVLVVHDQGNLRNAACDCGSSIVQWATVKGAHCTPVFVITKYRFSYATLQRHVSYFHVYTLRITVSNTLL